MRYKEYSMRWSITNIFFICALALNIAGSLFAKRMPPTTPPAELAQVKEQFVKAVQEKNWQEVNHLLDHKNAWSFANVIIPGKSIPELKQITALELALDQGQKDVAKKLIKVTGAYCGTKSELIQILEDDNLFKQSTMNTIDPQSKMILEKSIQKIGEILQLLKQANSRCY